jgi:preprotein translocase subunit SecF
MKYRATVLPLLRNQLNETFMALPIIKKSKVWYLFSGMLLVVSVFALTFWKLNFGIDFTGGTLMSFAFSGERPDGQKILEVMKPLDLGDITLQNSGTSNVNLRFREVDEPKHQEILKAFATEFPGAKEQQFQAIGSVVGQELKTRSVWAILLVLVFILVFLSWAFRKVSRPVSSWKYGTAAIIALFHDVIITLGIFSFLGHFLHVEIGAAFIAAVLTVIAYSVSDTIVVFDRTRENLLKMKNIAFEDVVNTSINQTMQRSINTSLTILLSLFAIFLFGGDSIKYFALALIIGVFFGTYSSIFIASPIIVTWYKRSLEVA